MKRWILFCVAFLFAISASFAVYLYVYRAEFLSLAISKAIDIPVNIKRLDFAMNGITMEQITVENPAGNKVKNALTVNKLKIKLDFLNLLKDLTGIGGGKIVIDEIKFDKPMMNVELYSIGSSDNNWTKIVERSSHKQTAQTSKSPRRFYIKKFLITNLQLEVKYSIVPEGSLRPSPIAKIELKNLGKDNPLTTQEVLRVVFEELLERAATDLKLKLPKD